MKSAIIFLIFENFISYPKTTIIIQPQQILMITLFHHIFYTQRQILTFQN